MKPTQKQLEQWRKVAFRRAASYCRYGHSIPDSIARGMAKLAYKEAYLEAYKEGYKAALAANKEGQ